MTMPKGTMPNTKTIRVLLVQPPCEDRETLLRLLKRLGFVTEVSWPPVAGMFEYADVVFIALRPIFEENVKFSWNSEAPPAALVALLDFENPAIVNEAIRMNAHAVLGMPIRSFGVVANAFIALKNHKLQVDLANQNNRLKARIDSQKVIDQAKDILIRTRGISEAQAHEAMRSHAMNKRVSIQEIAKSIVSAEEILSEGTSGTDAERNLGQSTPAGAWRKP